MKFKAIVKVSTRKEQVEPESETIKKALIDLNFQVAGVRTAKVYEILLDAETKKEAEAVARAMCSKLLVNPIKDDYVLEVEQVGSSAAKS